MKFTDVGECELSAAIKADAVLFTVRDTGAGIAAEDLPRIFEPFIQVGPSTTRVVGGSGLGLSVSERLAELLGGTISVRSAPGKGTTFVVRIPRALPDPGLTVSLRESGS